MVLTFKVGRLARLVGVHRNTITNWIKKGKLKADPAPGKRYTISRRKFSRFCRAAHIPDTVRDRVLSDPGVTGTPLHKAQSPKERGGRPAGNVSEGSKSCDRVLVVGGGIAGIQAALDLADLGVYVYLVEQSSCIGGTMARLDKTFPTNDCAPCILLPRLTECIRRSNVELITLAEVDHVSGWAGQFKVRIRIKPRYIDARYCLGCGICAENCPVCVDDEFNLGLGRTKAAYIRYAQSVPMTYAIDPSACLGITRGICRACERLCPSGAVDFAQTETWRQIQVAAVVLAPGFSPFDPSRYDYFGYSQLQDVVTSLEFERLLGVDGPGRGRLQRPSDRKVPQKIAWVQCAGSRNHNRYANTYCSNICCMASIKQSLCTPERTDAGTVDRTIFFLDLRTHGKNSEAYFERARAEGVRFVRALPHTLVPGPGGTGVRVRYLDDGGHMVVDTFDLLVLGVGFEVHRTARDLAAKFGVGLDNNGFARTPYFEPVLTSRKGIYTAGSFKTPASISRAVIQASAAVACLVQHMPVPAGANAGCDTDYNNCVNASDRARPEEPVLSRERDNERDIAGEPPRIGVFICSCGMNISGVVNVPALAEAVMGFEHVNYVENNTFSCSFEVQERIGARIRERRLNRIVIAACSPFTHGHMFQDTLRSAGLNGFLVEIANIRNQNAWVHQTDPSGATQKAVAQVRMAVAKAALAAPLAQVPVDVVKAVLVVGGGLAGMTCALAIAGMGIDALMVEKTGRLGGNALHLDTCFNGEKVAPVLEALVKQVTDHPRIRVIKEARIEQVAGSVGNFTARINTCGQFEPVRFGAAVMATGAVEDTPVMFGYGQDARVVTQLEFDRRVLADPCGLDTVSAVTFIQCVGSRQEQKPYCSRICCIHSVRAAIALKTRNPKIQVTVAYREMRTYGEWEDLYTSARAMGVVFIRYTQQSAPQVDLSEDKVLTRMHDPLSDSQMCIPCDYLVLASGVKAGDNTGLAALFQAALDPDGFFNGAHPKLRPVECIEPGLFLAGLCTYPKPMDESIEEACAAAMKAGIFLLCPSTRSQAVHAYVTEQCDGCALCVDACPFGAITLVPGPRPNSRQVAVDPAMCRGCGICAATCARNGIQVQGFTMDQLSAQVRTAVLPAEKNTAQKDACQGKMS